MDTIESILDDAIASRVFPGCVVGTVNSSGERTIFPAGRFTYDANSPQMTADSIFDIASVTKSIPTACLALQLIDQNRLGLRQRIVELLPELRMSMRESITVKHLLTHTLDWGFSLASLKDKTADEILQAIFSAEFKSRPGTRASNSNATSILLGLVIERAAGQKLDVLADDNFFRPLNMNNTSFHPERFDKTHIVPTEKDPWRGRLLQGEIHDESAWKLRKKIVAGSAGVFSTVPDLLNFMEMLLRGGELNNRRYFKPETVAQMATNQLGYINESMGLGWELNNPSFMGDHAETIFGKTGFVGTMVLGNLDPGKAMVMLSNHTYPLRRKNSNQILDRVRLALAKIISDLT